MSKSTDKEINAEIKAMFSNTTMRPKITNCKHNNRCRYTHGFRCEDCSTFFPKDSPTYRQDEYMSTLWAACHNLNAYAVRAGLPSATEALEMKDKIGIGKLHENYEEIIAEAEELLSKHPKEKEYIIP